MLLKISLVLTVLLSLIAPSTCKPARETNAQRLARGLPLLPPKFVRTVQGKSVREPTPVRAAKRGGPSSLPPVGYQGCIQARDENGNVLGSIQNTNTSTTIGGLNLSGKVDQDLKVRFTAPRSGEGPFDITVTNPSFPAPFYVGAARPAGSVQPRLQNTDTMAFSNVQQTPLWSVPVVSTYNQTNVVESAIWSINPRTKEINAQYINVDQTPTQPAIAYDAQQNILFFVADLDAYNQDNAKPVSAVKLYIA